MVMWPGYLAALDDLVAEMDAAELELSHLFGVVAVSKPRLCWNTSSSQAPLVVWPVSTLLRAEFDWLSRRGITG
jgi:hypothetical protein